MDIVCCLLQFFGHFLLVLCFCFLCSDAIQDPEQVVGRLFITGAKVLVIISNSWIIFVKDGIRFRKCNPVSFFGYNILGSLRSFLTHGRRSTR